MTSIKDKTFSINFDTSELDKTLRNIDALLNKAKKGDHHMKYKVGDKVKVREDLAVGMDIKFGVVANMVKFAGKTVTIDSIFEGGYRIVEEGYSWCDSMFTGNATRAPLFYVQVEDGVSGFLNRRNKRSCLTGDIELNSNESTYTTDTKFTAFKGLKYLRQYSKKHTINLEKIKFIPVEKAQNNVEDAFTVEDTSKDTFNFINLDTEDSRYWLDDQQEVNYIKTHLTKDQVFAGIDALQGKLDPSSLKITKVAE